MVVNRLLTQLANGVENCPREEWLPLDPALKRDDRLALLISKRDPLGDVKFPGIEVAFVAAFSTSPEPPALVYFWSPDFGDLSYENPRTEIGLDQLMAMATLLGSIVSSAQPNLAGFRNAFELQLTKLFSEHPGYFDHKHLYWVPYSDVLFVALFSTLGVTEGVSTTSILDCIGLHNDYFRIKSPIWNSAPLSFLSRRVQKDQSLVGKLLLDPKCFNPFEKPPSGWFLWPWQQSLASAQCDEDEGVHYSPIETTSLVFDLRKSTMALEQLRDDEVGLFSGFIKDVVDAARRAVLDHGGFFDKETGDGIVAHFCDFALPDADIEPPTLRAFNAAKRLIGTVHGICDRFQEKLNMGVGGLGASVGIHSGKAVWICEQNLVSAYGESVILAARICAEAEIGSIFVSNHVFHKLAPKVPAEVHFALRAARLPRQRI